VAAAQPATPIVAATPASASARARTRAGLRASTLLSMSRR
jgi:hypothetical protein